MNRRLCMFLDGLERILVALSCPCIVHLPVDRIEAGWLLHWYVRRWHPAYWLGFARCRWLGDRCGSAYYERQESVTEVPLARKQAPPTTVKSRVEAMSRCGHFDAEGNQCKAEAVFALNVDAPGLLCATCRCCDHLGYAVSSGDRVFLIQEVADSEGVLQPDIAVAISFPFPSEDHA